MQQDDRPALAKDSEQPGSDRTELYTGRCANGPLTGHVVQSRYPNGFVLVDKRAKLAWIYEYRAPADNETSSSFEAREHEGRLLDDQKRLDAALGTEYDVRAQ